MARRSDRMPTCEAVIWLVFAGVFLGLGLFAFAVLVWMLPVLIILGVLRILLGGAPKR